LAVARSGTPYQNRVTASTTTTVTIPSGAAVGALGIIYAFSSLTGAWGATPSGWTVVPNGTQTGTAPSCIAYYKILTSADLGANVTITAQGSATMAVGGFAYTGAQGFDANNNQHNASSTTCTAPAVTATGLADMLVMIGGCTPSGTFTVASSGGNGLTLWVGANSSGVADKQLSAAGSTSTSAMTLSGAAADDGITLTLFQLDSDGEAPTSGAHGRARMLRFSRPPLMATGYEEETLVTSPPDERTVARAPRLRAFRARTQSIDDSRTIVDDDPPRRRVRFTGLRLPASVAPAADRHASVLAGEAFCPPVRRWDRFRCWARQVAEDFGLILPAAPSFRFAATLDLSLIFAAATLDTMAVFDATLNPPVIFGATLG
jgi:hypothetical protein